MRRTGRRSQPETKQQLIRPSNEQERIDSALLLMATRLNKVLTERMIEMWHADLSVYPVDGIEWAFDSWGRNAKRLPVLSDITQLLNTWQGGGVPESGCSDECKANHGTGYDGNDCMWLWKRICALGRKPLAEDWEKLFAELDKTRNGGQPKAFRDLSADWMTA